KKKRYLFFFLFHLNCALEFRVLWEGKNLIYKYFIPIKSGYNLFLIFQESQPEVGPTQEKSVIPTPNFRLAPEYSASRRIFRLPEDYIPFEGSLRFVQFSDF